MDGVFDALVSAAAADVARHRLPYLVVGRFWIFHQERGRLHDLTGLAIAALRNIQLAPSLLNWMVAGRCRPSIVVTSLPTTSETDVMQERTASLSTITVHAPKAPGRSQIWCLSDPPHRGETRAAEGRDRHPSSVPGH